MENKQEGKGKRKAAEGTPDTRQMDLWSAGQPAPVAEKESRNPAQQAEPVSHVTPIAKAREHRRKTTGPGGAVKVTVSGSSRHAAHPYSGRTLPALTRRQHELLDAI